MEIKKDYAVSEYMQRNVVTVSKTATFRDAVEIMIKNHTNGAVVIDESNKVIGILSSSDFIQHIVPDYLEEDKHLASFEAGDVFIKRIKKVNNDSVTKFMTKSVHTIKPHHTLIEASTLLSEFHIRQLPVVDEAGVLIGYINRTDIKKAIGQVLGINN